jgi:3D (Asp-Asp-Asp) domain-containing protein
LGLVLGCGAGAGAGAGDGTETRTLVVTATAYNSVVSQTGDHPNLGAWGDTLRPGMKSIAVSRDLIARGLGHNARVRIEGLEGEYVVKDKMNKRWTEKIDIYMGTDVEAARRWGKRKVRITWQVPD